ncbi:magnesium-translocating P-type ATPase [Leptolyngbya ohadii]|uniref:magnesium-translocating P-type ATPase n=1 Tax=Leptolyngbya ohadii TaxID=1962290 RepID=UPI000B5A0A2D|nr:magnesium-translocating P-type ATPase [Leptolyngbya ohadii]
MAEPTFPFWNQPADRLLEQLHGRSQGLSSAEAQQILSQSSSDRLFEKSRSSTVGLLLNQFKSPIILILIVAAVLSGFLEDLTDTVIILLIVLASGLLGFWQERGAADAMSKLLALVEVKATVLRDGRAQEIATDQVVPGDIIQLAAGSQIPGDCLLLEGQNLAVNEAALTGETYPVDKTPGILPAETPLSKRTNTLFLGTNVVSGTGSAVVVQIGKSTQFGQISQRLRLRSPETEFERGIRRFGYFLAEVTLILVILIFAANVFLQRPVLDSFLFSLALAVGLTPQLLPAIVSVNLSHGARQMAKQQVIVKHLPAIENFGSMNVLCSDKTGTLTDGTVQIHAAVDAEGNDRTRNATGDSSRNPTGNLPEANKILFYAYLNAISESGYANPIDEAICGYQSFDTQAYQKLGEIPYDFIRKRLSILVAQKYESSEGNRSNSQQNNLLITKGSLKSILDICSKVELSDGKIATLEPMREQIQQRFEQLGLKGFRTLGVAYRELTTDSINKTDEREMTFLGGLTLYDPPKPGIQDTIATLSQMGVSLKIITGDSHAVAQSISQQVGLTDPQVLTGKEMRSLSDEALIHQVQRIDVFAEIEPNQKEHIILALKKAGNVVGYMGDGINDASALHAADVGISVNTAVDVAKEAAEIVLMQQNLDVLIAGVKAGRETFGNTLKYVFMATSANFGNMFSMAGASLFLPFLPLLPKQILLTNLLTDFPEITIATDRVDREFVAQPHRWNLAFIRRFMIVFGLVSSLFDYLTFAALLLLLKATPAQFQTGWFMESVISASLIVLVVRTRRSITQSKPGKYLLWATLAIVLITLLLPLTPIAKLLGFTPLPLYFLLVLGAIVGLYVLTAESVKHLFYRQVRF